MALVHIVIIVISCLFIAIASDAMSAEPGGNIRRIELELGINHVHLSGPESNDVIVMFEMMRETTYQRYIIMAFTQSDVKRIATAYPVRSVVIDHSHTIETYSRERYSRIGHDGMEGFAVVTIDTPSCFEVDASFYFRYVDGEYKSYYVTASSHRKNGDIVTVLEKFILEKRGPVNNGFGEPLQEYAFVRFGKPLELHNPSLCRFEDLEQIEKEYLEQSE